MPRNIRPFRIHELYRGCLADSSFLAARSCLQVLNMNGLMKIVLRLLSDSLSTADTNKYHQEDTHNEQHTHLTQSSLSPR